METSVILEEFPSGTKLIAVAKWGRENGVPLRTAYRWMHSGKLESIVLGQRAHMIVERPEATAVD
jgi:predicted site-specific integrase-resolvase